jgi:hypothetical protein
MPLPLVPGDMVVLSDDRVAIITKADRTMDGTVFYNWTIPVEHGSSPARLVKWKVTHLDDWERIVGMK